MRERKRVPFPRSLGRQPGRACQDDMSHRRTWTASRPALGGHSGCPFRGTCIALVSTGQSVFRSANLSYCALKQPEPGPSATRTARTPSAVPGGLPRCRTARPGAELCPTESTALPGRSVLWPRSVNQGGSCPSRTPLEPEHRIQWRSVETAPRPALAPTRQRTLRICQARNAERASSVLPSCSYTVSRAFGCSGRYACAKTPDHCPMAGRVSGEPPPVRLLA